MINRRTVLFALTPVILFAILAICINMSILTGFEEWVYGKAAENMSPALTSIMNRITHIGDSSAVIAFCPLLLIVPKTRKTVALPISSALITSVMLNETLKHIFARSRPDILRLINETGYSFPSGHAMNNATLYTMLILLINRYVRNTHLKLTLSSICVALAVMIGCSRIYLGVHYAGDVLGGWLLGSALSVIIYSMWENKLD